MLETIANDPVYPMQIYALTDEERAIWAEDLAPSYENNVKQAASVNPQATEIAEAYMALIDSISAQLSTEGYPW